MFTAKRFSARILGTRMISNYPKSKSGKLLTPYIRFSQEVRNDIITSQPALDFKDIGRAIGERWRGLTEEARQRYKDEYAEVKKSDI